MIQELGANNELIINIDANVSPDQSTDASSHILHDTN